MKKKREIAFALISFFHVQIQEPASRSTINYYSKKEVIGNLSVCVDESSPCGHSINGDIKIYQFHVIKRLMALLPTMKKCPVDFYQGAVFTVQFS